MEQDVSPLFVLVVVALAVIVPCGLAYLGHLWIEHSTKL